jgi:hypothetical protein
LSQYQVVYCSSSDGKYYKALNNGTKEQSECVGIAVDTGGIGNGDSGTIWLHGIVVNNSWNFTASLPVYVDSTSGGLTQTKPSAAGSYLKVVGYALSTTSIWFGTAPTYLVGTDQDVITGTAGEALSQFDVVYLDSVSSAFKKAENDATASQADAVGIVVQAGGISNASTGLIQLFGYVKNTSWTWSVGNTLYVNTTPGGLSAAPPTAPGTYTKSVGFALSATEIYFSPSLGFETDASSSAGGAIPDYCPPAIKYKDTSSLYIPKGRYYRAGSRFRGQYQDISSMGLSWDLTSTLAVTITGPYVPGTTAGILGGKVANSWYSVFMVGNTAADILLLPYIRINLVDYNSSNTGYTTIKPGSHDSSGVADNSFLTANDQWNTYRLMKYAIAMDTTDGSVLTIADTVNGTPDQVLITGDQVSTGATLAVGDYLQMLPPSGTQCLYLGSIRFDGSGNLRGFTKQGWKYKHKVSIEVAGNKSTSFDNTEVIPGVPPTASLAYVTAIVSSGGSAVTQVRCELSHGTADNNTLDDFLFSGSSSATTQLTSPCAFPMSATSLIRNRFTQYAGSNAGATTGTLRLTGFEE